MKIRTASIICLPLLLAGAGFSQNAATVAPFTGEEVAQRTQTLPDGTQVSEKTSAGRLYRDSRGRTRTERSMAPDAADAAVTVEIVDPAAGVRYSLDARHKVAHRSPLTPVTRKARVAESPSAAAASQAAAPQQQVALEPLGKRVMDGIVADGQRILATILPAPESNDRLMVVTTEMWVSQELGITLSSRVVDPRMGEITYRVSNVTLREPDASLFQVPSDFTIVDAATPGN